MKSRVGKLMIYHSPNSGFNLVGVMTRDFAGNFFEDFHSIYGHVARRFALNPEWILKEDDVAVWVGNFRAIDERTR